MHDTVMGWASNFLHYFLTDKRIEECISTISGELNFEDTAFLITYLFTKNDKISVCINSENLPGAMLELESLFSKIFIYSRKGVTKCKG